MKNVLVAQLHSGTTQLLIWLYLMEPNDLLHPFHYCLCRNCPQNCWNCYPLRRGVNNCVIHLNLNDFSQINGLVHHEWSLRGWQIMMQSSVVCWSGFGLVQWLWTKKYIRLDRTKCRIELHLSGCWQTKIVAELKNDQFSVINIIINVFFSAFNYITVKLLKRSHLQNQSSPPSWEQLKLRGFFFVHTNSYHVISNGHKSKSTMPTSSWN